MSLEITPVELRARCQNGENIVVLDCRTNVERDIACIEHSIHTPFGELQSMLQDLLEHAEKTVVVHCHHGIRSLQATEFLRSEGFSNAYSLAGGIDRWSLEIDTSIPRY